MNKIILGLVLIANVGSYASEQLHVVDIDNQASVNVNEQWRKDYLSKRNELMNMSASDLYDLVANNTVHFISTRMHPSDHYMLQALEQGKEFFEQNKEEVVNQNLIALAYSDVCVLSNIQFTLRRFQEQVLSEEAEAIKENYNL